jgi:hypothetical protein
MKFLTLPQVKSAKKISVTSLPITATKKKMATLSGHFFGPD